MAKSLRSKRKRKVRAEKRVVNAKKELVKLRLIAAKLHGTEETTGTSTKLTKESLESMIPDANVIDCPMQVDGQEASKPTGISSALKINPQWMNQKRIKAIKTKLKRENKKKARRGGSAGLSSRKAKKSRK